MLILALVFALFLSPFAATSVDKQLKSNTEALKKTQANIQKAEAKVKELEYKESGVLKTIAEIDNGLTQTREYIIDLQKKENSLKHTITGIEKEIDVLQQNIDEQKKAIATRIKNLYTHKQEEWELLLNLLKDNENPERKIYWVQRLLEGDKIVVENHLASMSSLREKKQQLGTRQLEMAALHENKTKEEVKLQNQLLFQNDVLTKVKKDKSTQERAIEEYRRNQQSLAAIIAALEKKRQAEIKRQEELAAKKKSEEQKKAKVAVPKETPVAIGPKCTPLTGQIISDYGYHVNRDLNIKIMHLGTEIRGQKGESIKAAATGTVVMVGNLPGHGPSVILDHKGSYYSVYGHLAAIKVKEGENVRNCQEIGTVGNAESTNGYKLFFQVYKGTQTQDPMKWLKN
ncbi:MAG: peptidoglycan DD-metalloendopeptidase family protein [Candidatus Fibromonas sp.]|jgi:septal ring factor EnvC (AmiA/AmiB activator)|nr:peptidoglycan DD-metalloendopeptidase family protein [Candidatus Fibromonas sp.]